MNFFEFANPEAGGGFFQPQDLLAFGSGEQAIEPTLEDGAFEPPKAVSYHPVVRGVHYQTWRNVIARESLAENEVHDPLVNPEPIPEPRLLYRYQDQNFIQCIQPLQTFAPTNLAEIQAVVKYAVGLGLKVKAVGSGHSFSDIATTADFLVVTDGLNRMLFAEPTYSKGFHADAKKPSPNIRHFPFLRPEAQGNYIRFLRTLISDDANPRFYGYPQDNPTLVEFEAGIKIKDLNDELWNEGYSLYNMGTYQGQSFIGAAATSTHGSGHKLPPLPDMIKSMVIVADGGYVFRIEPGIGITQPTQRVTGRLPFGPPETWQTLISKGALMYSNEAGVDYLIQDNDWFASALVNVGTFGIVYSVIIEVVPRYYLLETVEFTTWENLKERLVGQNHLLHRPREGKNHSQWHEVFDYKAFTARWPRDPHRDCYDKPEDFQTLNAHDIRQTTVEVHPHAYELDGKQHHLCRVIRQYRVSASHPFARLVVRRNDKGRTLGENLGAVLIPLNMVAEGGTHDMDNQDEHYQANLLLVATALMRPVQKNDFDGFFDTLRQLGEAIALFSDEGREKLLKKILRTRAVQPKCWDYYLNRNYRTQVIAQFPGYGVELGFSTKPVKNTGSMPAYIAAVDRVLEIAAQHWEQGRYVQTSPIALRLVKASNAYLSMQYADDAEPTAMIELLNQIDTIGGKELMYRYQRELFKYGARPHWGLDFSVTTGNNGLLEKMYPKFPEWHAVYKALNHNGTFRNRFTDRMGL